MKAPAYIVLLLAAAACSPRAVPQPASRVMTETIYRDRIVHDTVDWTLPAEVVKVMTPDTSSHLETAYARSDASVSGGILTHTLEAIPTVIRVPVAVPVTDTERHDTEVRTETVEVERELTRWESFRLRWFWPSVLAIVLLLLWTFRKIIAKAIL